MYRGAFWQLLDVLTDVLYKEASRGLLIKEVIEMTDDDVGTTGTLWYTTYPITCEEENNG